MKDYFLYTIGYLFRLLLIFLSMCFGYMLPALFLTITQFDITQYSVISTCEYYPYIGGICGIVVVVLWVKSLEFRY